MFYAKLVPVTSLLATIVAILAGKAGATVKAQFGLQNQLCWFNHGGRWRHSVTFRSQFLRELGRRFLPDPTGQCVALMRVIGLYDSIGCLLGFAQFPAIKLQRPTLFTRRFTHADKEASLIRDGHCLDGVVQMKTVPITHLVI